MLYHHTYHFFRSIFRRAQAIRTSHWLKSTEDSQNTGVCHLHRNRHNKNISTARRRMAFDCDPFFAGDEFHRQGPEIPVCSTSCQQLGPTMQAVKSLSVCAHSTSRLQSHAVVTYTHRVAENFRSAPAPHRSATLTQRLTVAPLRTVLVTWITDLKERPLHIKRTADERDRLPGHPGGGLTKVLWGSGGARRNAHLRPGGHHRPRCKGDRGLFAGIQPLFPNHASLVFRPPFRI